MEIKDKNTDTEENYLGDRNLPRQRIIRTLSAVIQNLTGQLLFIASILAGFIFTILFDLVLAPQYVNNFLLSVVFAFLLVSGFSLLVSIIIGAMVQFVGHPELLDMMVGTKLSSYEGDSISKKEFNNLLKRDFGGIPSGFFLWGSIAEFIAFLFGIFCFGISITIFGWIRSPWFGCLSILLIIVPAAITFFIIWKITMMLKEKVKDWE